MFRLAAAARVEYLPQATLVKMAGNIVIRLLRFDRGVPRLVGKIDATCTGIPPSIKPETAQTFHSLWSGTALFG